MNGYTKLFSSILDSTIWQEDLATKVLWVTMLAMSDYEGIVEGSIPGLAHRAGISVDECEKALAKLYAPDKYSRTPDYEGRRVEAIDGGWLILNRVKYRDKGWEDDRVKRHREANRRYYDRTKNSDNPDPKLSESDGVGDKKEKEKEKEKENTESKAMALRAFVPPTLREVTEYCMERNSEVEPEKFHDYYTSQGWYVGKHRMKDWRAAVRNWERNNKGGPFRGGYQASSNGISKQQQRVINNREAILVGLGISPMPGQCEPSVQHGDATGASPDMAGRLLKGKA